MKKTIKSGEYMMLDTYLNNGLIKTFYTKKEVQEYAKSIGWDHYHVVKIERRFEKVWIVGQNHIQKDNIVGLEFDTFRCPTGNYENKNGCQHMIVLEVKKLIEKSA
jgi:hypothetical protein